MGTSPTHVRHTYKSLVAVTSTYAFRDLALINYRENLLFRGFRHTEAILGLVVFYGVYKVFFGKDLK